MHNIPEYATLSPSVSDGAPRKSDFATGQFIARISALGNFFIRISAARQTLRRSYSVRCCWSPRIVYFSGFFVMAIPGLDPGIDRAIHENTESCSQGNDNVT
jgi:hypothetical protein